MTLRSGRGKGGGPPNIRVGKKKSTNKKTLAHEREKKCVDATRGKKKEGNVLKCRRSGEKEKGERFFGGERIKSRQLQSKWRKGVL